MFDFGLTTRAPFFNPEVNFYLEVEIWSTVVAACGLRYSSLQPRDVARGRGVSHPPHSSLVGISANFIGDPAMKKIKKKGKNRGKNIQGRGFKNIFFVIGMRIAL